VVRAGKRSWECGVEVEKVSFMEKIAFGQRLGDQRKDTLLPPVVPGWKVSG
jgi:hypothetical protein